MLTCKICDHEAESSLQSHLMVKHSLTPTGYHEMYPDATIFSESLLSRLGAINREKNSSPEFRKKVSRGLKKLWQDPEYAQQMGKKLSESLDTEDVRARRKITLQSYFDNRTEQQRDLCVTAIKDSWRDSTKRSNRVRALKKAHNDPVIRERHSAATKKLYSNMSPEDRFKKRLKLKEIWGQPENRIKILKISKIGLAKANSPEGRVALAAANRRPEVQAKRRRAAQLNSMKQRRVSALNNFFEKALSERGLFPLKEQPVGFYVVDFLFPENKIIIEVDGDYWHANPQKYDLLKINKIQRRVVAKDKREGTYCLSHGYTLLRFWESAIYADVTSCINKVIGVIHGIPTN